MTNTATDRGRVPRRTPEPPASVVGGRATIDRHRAVIDLIRREHAGGASVVRIDVLAHLCGVKL